MNNLTFYNNKHKNHNYLHNKLEKLEFGDLFKEKKYEFNKNINNLPSSLIKLTTNSYFNKNVNNLPISLLQLIFGGGFNKIVNKLPYNLLYLKFSLYYQKKIENLPLKLEYLYFNNDYDEYFRFGYNNIGSDYESVGRKHKANYEYNFDFLPESLKRLKISPCYSKKINDLPASLKSIYIEEYNKKQEKLVNKIYKDKIKYYR